MSGQDNDNLTNELNQLEYVEKIVAKEQKTNTSKKNLGQVNLMEILGESLNEYETLMNKIQDDFNTDPDNLGVVITSIQKIIQKLNFDPNFYQVSDGKDHDPNEDFVAISDTNFKQAIDFMDKYYMTFYEIYNKYQKLIGEQ